jgi:hypothetical protein
MSKMNPKKKWNRYFRLDGTKEFIKELEVLGGIPPNDLIDKRQNGNSRFGSHTN